jgi:hypothetical protein
MKKILFYTAITGWSLGLLVHLLSIAGINVSDNFPFVWLLHIGIFVVWIPAIFELRKNPELKEREQSGLLKQMKPFGYWKIIFKDKPVWLSVLAIAGLVYAFFNFMFFTFQQTGSTDFQNGQYILHNHGQLIRTISIAEYNQFKADITRGFSGHWMAFYGFAAAVLFPVKESEDSNLEN